jgi:hypothetical protein
MLVLDFSNAPRIVFGDPVLRGRLPEFQSLYDSWLSSRRASALRQQGNKAVMDFLAAVEPRHLEVISGHVGEEVRVEKLDYHIVKDVKIPIVNLGDALNAPGGYVNFAVTRDATDATVCFWR